MNTATGNRDVSREAQIASIVRNSIDVKQAILGNRDLLRELDCITEGVTLAFRKGHRLWFCGNGGSAADAQHLAAEFSGRFYKDRAPLPAEALHVNTSYLTAVANDYSYNEIYARMIRGSATAGDVLIGLSTSGNSANIVAAFEQARSQGVVTVGLTGASGGLMKSLSDHLLTVPSTDTPRIQEAHILLGHILCELVEAALFPNNNP